MKITFVLSTLKRGGAERVVSLISNELINRGYEVSIILMSNIIEYQIDKKIKIISIEEEVNKKSIIPKIFRRIKVLRKHFKDNEGIIISFLSTINMYSILAKMGLKSKLIVSERNDPNNDPKSKLKRKLRNLLYKKPDGFLFQTNDAKKYFSKKIQEKSEVILNPVSSNLPIHDINNSKNKIVAIGRLEVQKNYPMLLNAFSKFVKIYPDYTLNIYGEGTLRQSLNEYVTNLGISDKVIFEGNKLNVHELINDCRMYVLTSNFEGMPNALIEALSMGIPSIATDSPIGGVRELIKDGENGYLINIGNEDALLEKMIIIHEDKNLRNAFSNKSKEINSKLSVENITNQYIALINKIFKGVKDDN